MEQPFHRWNTVRQCQHHYLIIGFDLEIVGGDITLAVTGDATNDGISRHGQLSDGFSGDC